MENPNALFYCTKQSTIYIEVVCKCHSTEYENEKENSQRWKVCSNNIYIVVKST